jgi:hypothetical protein
MDVNKAWEAMNSILKVKKQSPENISKGFFLGGIHL